MASKNKFQIPFDNGYMVHTVHWKSDRIEWRDYYEFEDELSISQLHNYSTATYLTLKSVTGNETYTMFVSDFVDMTKVAEIKDGKVKGKFGFRKVGRSCGIIYIN